MRVFIVILTKNERFEKVKVKQEIKNINKKIIKNIIERACIKTIKFVHIEKLK